MNAGAAEASFSCRQVKIYQPFADAVPTCLVGAGADLEFVRIAKWQGQVIGGYRMTRLAPLHFGILALAVYEGYRGCGVGRWLLGHAIGIAESKGARIVDAPVARTSLFRAVGFEPCADGCRLQLAPE